MERDVQDQLRQLYRELQLNHRLGVIHSGAYNIGMQVLRELAEGQCLEVVMTWGGMAGVLTMKGDEILASDIPDTRMDFYAAVQELHHKVWLFSNVTREGMDEDVAIAENTGEANPHVTRWPGECSHLIGPNTFLIFRYVAGSPDYVTSLQERFTSIATLKTMPEWVH